MTLATLADHARRWPDRVVTEALPLIAQSVKDDVLDAARRDAGADLRLSHMRRAKVAVSFDEQRPDLIVTPAPLGPWQLLESGSHKRSWWIPRDKKGRKRIRIGDDIRWFVRHGPVRGKHTWSRARTAAAAHIPAVIDRVATAALAELDG